jgi:hypothetical protein
MTNNREILYTLSVYNSLGNKILSGLIMDGKNTCVTPVDLRQVQNGIYTVVLTGNSGDQIVRKILKIN